MKMLFAAMHESAISTKQTWASAPHMSAFGGKADMPFCTLECALNGGQFQAAVLTGCRAYRSSYCAGLI